LTNPHKHNSHHAHKGIIPSKWHKLKCSVCKKEFLRKKSHQKSKYIFCSRDCYKKGIGDIMLKFYNEKGHKTELLNCSYCNKNFNRRDNKIRKNYFCCRDCYYKSLSRLKDNKYWCNSCKKYLDKNSFNKDSRSRYQIRSYCRECEL